MIKEFLELECKHCDLGKTLKEMQKQLIFLVMGKNECIHLDVTNVGYESYERQAICLMDAQGNKCTRDFHNRVDPRHCSVCEQYKRNQSVKKSMFTGFIYRD